MTRAQATPDGVGPVAGAVRAARMLGVTERTILRWAEAGHLPIAYTTRGGHRRYALAELEKLKGNAPDDA